MTGPQKDPIEGWRELSALAARAGAVRKMRSGPPRGAAAAAGLGVLTVAAVVVGAALVLRPAAGPAAERPVTTTVDDGMLRLTLTTPRASFTTVDVIEPMASLTFLGPEPVRTIYHAVHPVSFRIEEIGGARTMTGGGDQPCNHTMLTRDQAIDQPFSKAGSPTDDPSLGFDRAWYEDPILRLPAGRWRVVAELAVTVEGCGGPRHDLTAVNEITVTPFVARTDPVVASTDDGTFRLELTTPHGQYAPGDAIEPIATVSYLGPSDELAIYHGGQIVGWTIDEVGGSRSMGGGMTAPCAPDVIRRDVPLTVPFQKSGAIDETFGRGWYDDPVLTLPVGTWRIRAYTTISADDGPAPSDGSFTCGTRGHGQQVEVVITVLGDPTSSASLEPSPVPTIAPSTTLSADALIARELVRQFENGIATDHEDVAWRFLSPWSRTTVGSFATFGDGARRLAAAAPGAVVVEDPTQSPDVLNPAFLGPRAVDLAAVADPARTFLVAVGHPAVDGAAAGTENLVVAPINGDWRIWLDTTPSSFGGLPFPQGCAAYELSNRRCDAVVNEAAAQAAVDRASATGITLLPEPGCGGDPLSDVLVICSRTTQFVAGVRFDLPDGRQVRQDIFCGVGPPSLVCSETPGIVALDFHSAGYWDVPCAGEAPAGCPSPIPSPTGPGGRELRIAGRDVPVGPVGRREVELGTAVLVDGIVQEARFSIRDPDQTGFLLTTGTIRLELRSTIAGRPRFDNAYLRGTFDGPEEVRVFVIFDVAETSPDAVIHLADVLVR